MIAGYTDVAVAIAVRRRGARDRARPRGPPPVRPVARGPAIVELLLIAQLVIAIVAPAAGNPPTGNPVEFYAYLLSALIIPPAAIVWALMERTRWSVVVVGVACFAVAVMLVRMQIIWTVQHA